MTWRIGTLFYLISLIILSRIWRLFFFLQDPKIGSHMQSLSLHLLHFKKASVLSFGGLSSKWRLVQRGIMDSASSVIKCRSPSTIFSRNAQNLARFGGGFSTASTCICGSLRTSQILINGGWRPNAK